MNISRQPDCITGSSARLISGSLLLLFALGLPVRAQFRVQTTAPAHGEIGVLNNSAIVVGFNQIPFPFTINTNSFVVSGQRYGRYPGTFFGGLSVTFTPSVPFLHGEKITVSLTTNIQAVTFQPLEPLHFEFHSRTLGCTNFTMNDSGQSLGDRNSLSVRLGDLDADGDLDAFVANNTHPNIVWLNDGFARFTESGQAFGSGPTKDVALGDLDGDGDLDALTVNEDEPNQVWLNNGFGTFVTSGQNLGPNQSLGVGLGDLDSDGDLDAFFANVFGSNTVWFNDGTGIFSNSGQHLGSQDSLGVSLSDINDDGHIDAFVSNIGSNEYWTNAGNGFFTAAWTSPVSEFCRSTALGDINLNSRIDVFAANGSPNKIWYNDGLGAFTDNFLDHGPDDSMDVSIGDLDADLDLDAFVANITFAGKQNTIWVNDGTGIYTNSHPGLGSNESTSVDLGDLDGDGDLDAFVANYSAPNRIWLNEGCLDLRLTKTGMPAVITMDNNITYTITISNPSPVYAVGAVVTDVLPDHTFYKVSIPLPNQLLGPTSVFNLGRINPLAITSIVIVAGIDSNFAGDLVNTARVETATLDSNLADNLATATNTVADTDNDGIPDFADLDDDNDGMTDADELIADTDPADPNSLLRIVYMTNIGSTVSIEWKGGSTAFQYLEKSPSVLPGITQWQTVYTNLPPTPITNTVSDPSSSTNTRAYYRIRVE